MNRDQIVAVYQQLLKKSGSRPPGMNALLRAIPGLSAHAFRGRLWRTWRAFQQEVGVQPNSKVQRLPDDQVLTGLAALARKLSKVPSDDDLMYERKRNPSAPSQSAVRRRARNLAERSRVLREFCSSRPDFADVLALLTDGSTDFGPAPASSGAVPMIAYVYLQKSGRRFKIGRTRAPKRRLGEVQLMVPDVVSLLHVIETDDPGGVETYWKKRFETKHLRGEWYALTPEDVASFRRWRSQ